MPPAIQRLLVIKLGPLDDCILLIPALRALRRALPETEIHWLVSSENRALAALVPHVDRVVELRSATPFHLIQLAATLKACRFDAVIDFEQRSRASALMSRGTGAPTRLGFYFPGQLRARGYTDRYWKYFARHESHEFLGLAGMLTPVVFDPALEMWETDEGKAEIQLLGFKKKGDGPLVVIHPGCGAKGGPREWPLPDYAVLGNWLLQNHGAEIVLTSTPEDRGKTRDLGRLLNGKALDLGGKLSLGAMVTLLGKADLVISGNTGAMHLAAALGRPQVALHGPSDPALSGPLNARARVVRSPCPRCPTLRFGHEYHTRDRSCMARIGVDDVKAAISDVWNQSGIA